MKIIIYIVLALLGLVFSYFVFLIILGSKFADQKFPYAVYEFNISGEQLEKKVYDYITRNNLKIEKTREEDNKYTSFKSFFIFKSDTILSFLLRYRGEPKNTSNPKIEFNGVYDEKEKKFLKAEDYIKDFENDFIKKLGVTYKRIK